MRRIHLDRESSSRAAIAGMVLDHLPGWTAATDPTGADLAIVAGALDDRLSQARAAATAQRVLVLAPLASEASEAVAVADVLGDVPSSYGESILHAPVMTRALAFAAEIPAIDYLETTTLRTMPDEIDDVTAPFLELVSDRGDVLLDQGSQAIAALLAFAGARTARSVRCETTPDRSSARLHIRFDDDTEALTTVGWAATAVWDAQLSGPSDVVRVELAPNIGLECQGQPVHVDERPIDPQQLETMGFLGEIEHALADTSTSEPTRWPLTMGVEILGIIDGARRSLADDGALAVL